MGRLGVDDLEDLSSARLDADSRWELITTARQCTFVFSSKDGWPMGVVMSYLPVEDRFWLTATAERRHARAVSQDPRVSLVVSNLGTSISGRVMVTVRGVATVHADPPTKDRILPQFARWQQPEGADALCRLLDSPQRVLIEVEPVSYAISHDSRTMPGDGRGGK